MLNALMSPTWALRADGGQTIYIYDLCLSSTSFYTACYPFVVPTPLRLVHAGRAASNPFLHRQTRPCVVHASGPLWVQCQRPRSYSIFLTVRAVVTMGNLLWPRLHLGLRAWAQVDGHRGGRDRHRRIPPGAGNGLPCWALVRRWTRGPAWMHR